MTTLEELSEQLQAGKTTKVRELVSRAMHEGHTPREIIDNGLIAGMKVVADKYKSAEVFVPHVLIAARAVNAGMELLKPYMMGEHHEPVGRVIVGTVAGDLHDIGKNMVQIMMESRGFEVIDLGVDVSPEQFYNCAVENRADVVCCSALLTTTIEELRRVVEYFKEHDYRDEVYIMIGGAPVTQSLCDHIGADCYTEDALEAAVAAYSYCLNKRRRGL